MLPHDPIPWLLEQEGLHAVRARRLLDIDLQDDADVVRALERDLAKSQSKDGSFAQSPMKTAGVLNLLDDLRAQDSEKPIARAASYLISLLESQPGYERACAVTPGSLRTPCDLCGFFGPYEDRAHPETMADGAREMNFYREYEPLLGPQKPVRPERRSSLDRAGPPSCYSWGLIPLSYTVEALCRAGYAEDERLQPAVNALLGVQRESGGWCRNLAIRPAQPTASAGWEDIPGCARANTPSALSDSSTKKQRGTASSPHFRHSPPSPCPASAESFARCLPNWCPASAKTAPSANPTRSKRSPPRWSPHASSMVHKEGIHRDNFMLRMSIN